VFNIVPEPVRSAPCPTRVAKWFAILRLPLSRPKSNIYRYLSVNPAFQTIYRTIAGPRLYRVILRLALPILVLSPALAQPAPFDPPPSTIPALLISDIHFDPLRDPAKVPLLNAAPLTEWAAILGAPPTPTADADYAAINKSCPIRPLVDPNNQLFQSALVAIHQQAFAPNSPVRFAVLTGDIVGHQFDCRYKLLFPTATPAQFRAFVEKTAAYVVTGLRSALPGMPIYITLGNDDTGCHDNSLKPTDDLFLAFAARLVAQTLPPANRAAALRNYPRGYYAASLPAPLNHTRIFVLDDVYQMFNYRTCGGNYAPTAQNAQLSWLAAQLDQVRAHHQQAWVIAHVPPGINPYSTFNSRIYGLNINVCRGGAPISFLSNDEFAQLLAVNADIVPLALFGHSHTDEMRLLKPSLGLPELTVKTTVSGPLRPEQSNAGVPVKILPSISPVFSELPSFTLAQIDPRTANLIDYTVILASNSTGIDTTWAPSYTFSTTYHASSFTPGQLAPLIAGMQADKQGTNPASQAYMREYRHYFYDDGSTPLPSVWPQLACAIDNISAAAYTGCTCPATPGAK
jgi:sphingomyelin phosphodiesterase acid-like 3